MRHHIGRLWRAVWQICAEVKQLQCAPKARHNPKEPNARFRNAKPILKEVVKACHGDELRPGLISPNERAEPNEEVLRVRVEVGVGFRSRRLMVLEVIETQPRVAHGGKEETSHKANRMVEPAKTADRAVHCVMRRDEKPGRQIALKG